MTLIGTIFGLLLVGIFYEVHKHKLERESIVFHLPTIRVKYEGFEAVYAVNGKIISGHMPRKQGRKISYWILRHRYALENGKMPKGKLSKDFVVSFSG